MINSGFDSRRQRLRVVIGLGLVLSLLLAACGNGDDDDIVIGYISGGDQSPFVFQVTESLRAEAEELGVTLVECDTQSRPEMGVECARTISSANLDAVINWQFFPDASEAVCEEYGNLPTVTMDTPNEPCAVTFVGANNFQAGIVAGTALGEWAQAELGCEYDMYLAVELPALPTVNEQRAGGTKEGFENVCGAIPDDKFIWMDKQQGGADALENIRRMTTDILTANPNARTILVSSPFSDADGIAVLAAADTAGRGDDIKGLVAHGAEEVGHDFIRNDPRWVGSVGYFPERYGSLALPAAVALVRGEEVPAEILMTHEMVNRDTIDSIYPSG